MADPAADRAPGDFRLLLALRYLRARRQQAFTSVVTVVSVLGVIVGVAALIIALDASPHTRPLAILLGPELKEPPHAGEEPQDGDG